MPLARNSFARDQHVKTQGDFTRILRDGPRDVRGPLVFNATSATTPKSRLGVRISRRCGSAPVRNRIKRLLRESFRVAQHDWPVAVDLIVTVRPHEPMELAAYQQALASAITRLCRKLKEATA